MATKTDMKHIGFNEMIEDLVDSTRLDEFSIARVMSVHKDRFVVHNGLIEFDAAITGRIMYSAENSLDYPTVGDWVYLQRFDDTLALIHDVVTRHTLLKRKASGKKVDFQLIAANIDCALIIQALDTDFNLKRLERYLVVVNDAGIQPMIVLTKSDLLADEEIRDRIAEVRTIVADDVLILALSNKSGDGVSAMVASLVAGQTYCLLGSSGVGKTTLLNTLLGDDIFETRPVRESDNRGMHTTTHRQLTVLPSGVMIVDVPGMREIGAIDAEGGIEQTFDDLAALSTDCKFSNCSHRHEKDCAILRAVSSGELAQARYEHYLKMLKESEHHAMTYHDKRAKGKSFAKVVKSAKKAKRYQQ